MVKKVEFYKYPSREEVENAFINVDYLYYVPYDLFIDLISIYCYSLDNKKVIWDRSKDDDFSKKYKEFLESIDFSCYYGTTPLMKCINIIRELQKEINFRSIELEEDFETEAFNFKEDITEEEYVEIKSIFNVDNDDVIAQILNFTSDINLNSGVKPSDLIDVVVQKAEKFTDIFRKNKSFLVKPNFKAKLYEKSFYVEKEGNPSNIDDCLIIIEDASKSMSENSQLIFNSRYAALNFKGTVHLYRISDDIIEFKSFNDRESKVNYFKEDIIFKVGNCDYNLVKEIMGNYKDGQVILVTDGENNIPNINTKVKINCVTNKINPSLKNLCKKTKGKYLML